MPGTIKANTESIRSASTQLSEKASEYNTLVEKLYRYFIKYPDKMPEEYINIMNRFSKERAVCDYVSGMTDLYAVNLYNELFIPKSWKLT